MIFRIISFSKVCVVHPGTLESICDTKAYEGLYDEIKRGEVLDGPPPPVAGSSIGLPTDTKVEDVASDVLPASSSYSKSQGASHGTEGTRKVIKKRWADTHSEPAEQEDQPHEDSHYEEEPLDPEAEAREQEEKIQRSLDRLTGVAETLMSNHSTTAHAHITQCRNGFQVRNANPYPNQTSGSSTDVPRMTEAFGPDHKSLEGFDQYEDSLKTALLDEMTSQLKKADLAKKAPDPALLREEKEKDRKLELAKLADAAKGSGQGAPGTSAKAKARPRSKNPNFLGPSGNRAAMENIIKTQAKLYASVAKKMVPPSSNCDDLGRAIMFNRQENDQRQPVKMAYVLRPG